jgi:hypothetical protein
MRLGADGEQDLGVRRAVDTIRTGQGGIVTE